MSGAAFIPYARNLNDGSGVAEIRHRKENPYEWVEYEDYPHEEFEPDACIELFSLIIKQAFTDATYNLIDLDGNIKDLPMDIWQPSEDLQIACDDAQRWFFNAGRGYRNVCYYANQDAELLREIVLKRFDELNKILPDEWHIYNRLLI